MNERNKLPILDIPRKGFNELRKNKETFDEKYWIYYLVSGITTDKARKKLQLHLVMI